MNDEPFGSSERILKPAFGYRPDQWPPDDWFTCAPTTPQLDTVQSLLVQRELIFSARQQLAQMVLCEFGVPAHQHRSKGAQSLLIDFMLHGPVKSAEARLFGQEALF